MAGHVLGGRSEATTFTFHLREGVTFSDGAPVNAAAVKANLDEIVRLGAKSLFASTYLSVRLQGHDRGGRAHRQGRVRRPQRPVPPGHRDHLARAQLPRLARQAAGRRCRAPIGSGAFVLDRLQTDHSVTVKRRAGYSWPSSLAAHQGEAYLEAVEFRIVPEQGVRTGVLTSGQVHTITDMQPVTERQFRQRRFEVLSRYNPSLPYALYPSTFRPLLGDEAVHGLTLDPSVRLRLHDAWLAS
ncbi:ABC transporter substrate-binding protein [Nonomuraea sp. NPDC049309]|mgnify:CR=1 FL=1|uniref:ABC transporter substrate-binding protein n=1 Tax=Nonomuraea sp. NPDC049309 TaxID=3364350 RepID=UPI00371CD1EF